MRLSSSPGLEALVLPRPQLPRSRSSLSSSIASSPHTPRTPSCNSSFIFSPSNRTSTDSWNSSNGLDELEWDWKPEQVRLLSRTLDALPSHLVTPFNGPIPPSNLLDKIARGVSDAKGPIDWPHSIRATRVKLIELSRVRAKERAQQTVARESDDDTTYTGQNYTLHRPLYKQSSMDFINSADLKENDGIACFADRLQRVDRTSNSAYHPYARNNSRIYPRRLSSPIRPSNASSIATPSTPSSSTLNSLSSFSAHHNRASRTSSNMSFTSASSLSMGGGDALADPRVQRVKSSDSFCAPIPPPKDIKPVTPLKESTVGIKRPPSFGTLAQEARRDIQQSANVHEAIKDSFYPSSDEEEKIRTKSAKKLKVKEPASADKKAKTKLKEHASPDRKAKAGSLRSSQPNLPPGVAKEASTEAAVGTKGTKRVRPGAMNLQRNPSILGAELPHLRSTGVGSPPQSPRARIPTSPIAMTAPVTSLVLQKLSASPEFTPATPPKGKTLRRVQRLALGRRISFGSLVSPPEDADAESDDEDGGCLERLRQRELGQLGSAFQLH